MVDSARLRNRVSRIERSLTPLRSNRGGTADDFTTYFDEVDETPEASEETVGRGFLVRNDDADDVLSFGITAEDGTPILVDLSTTPSDGGVVLEMASLITGLTDISGVALDASGNIYTSHRPSGTTSTIRKYSSALVQQWTDTPTAQIAHAATDGTSIFFTNPSTPSVRKHIASSGAPGFPTSFGNGGTGNGQFGSGGPIGVVFDGTNVWVVDTGNSRVQKFTASTGAYVSQFDGSTSGDTFSGPTGIALGPSSTHLYVLDAPNGRVVKFLKSTHAFVSTFDLGVGTGEGQISDSAEGIAVDVSGRLWIADTGNHRINVYDSTGAFLATIGTFGGGSRQFKSPKQIAFNAAGTIAYVADSDNDRVVTVQEEVAVAAAVPALVLIHNEDFSGVASVSVNSKFSSTYENYLVVLSNYSSSATADLQVRLRASGTDDSTGNHYQYGASRVNEAGGVGQINSSSANQWVPMTPQGAAASDGGMSMTVQRPALADTTIVYWLGGVRDSNMRSYTGMGHNTQATAYDGFTLLPASGTFSGTLRIYGMRNTV